MNTDYPYAAIQRIWQESEEKPCAVSRMASQLLELLPISENWVPYKDARIDNFPGKMYFRPTSKNHLINHVVKHLAFFILTGEYPPAWFDLVTRATQRKDIDTLCHITQLFVSIRASDVLPVIPFIAMAKYEYSHSSRVYALLQEWVPCEKDIHDIITLTGLLVGELKDGTNLLHGITDIGEGSCVFNLSTDFIVGGTLYLCRLRRTYTRDIYHLLLCYVAVTQTPKYCTVPINHLCMIGLSDGSTRHIDMKDVDPMVLNIVHDCLYGMPF